MADRRRRRREDVTSESEYSEADTSKASIDVVKNSECESEGDDVQGEGSEYESATEENEEDDYTYTEDYSEDESSVLVEEEYTESDLFEEERQSGDGEEQPSSSQDLDDDEDRKNPAFVPRKGMFYEHDDRQGEEEAEAPPSEEKANIRKKKQLWQEAHRWDHDRFDEKLQAPKSREELIAAYGYDIQAQNKAPDAPPQRGRGGRYRGRPSENRANFGDYMAGRFDNPRKPRYGPKADTRGRGRGGRGGRGPRNNRWGRGDYRNTGPMEDREHGQGDRKTYSEFRSNNYQRNNSYNDEYDNSSQNRYDNNRYDNTRYDNNQNRSRPKGEGDGTQMNREHGYKKDRDYGNRASAQSKSETRTFTNSRVQGNQYKEYGSNKPNSGRSSVERDEPNRQSDFYQDRRYSQQEGGPRNREVSSRHEGPPFNSYSHNDRRERVNRKSRSPDGKRPSNPRAEASLDNLMDIAPPLTTIETRTKANLHTAVADTEGKRGYGRPRGGRRSQDDAKSDGQNKVREMPEKPPRFREQAKEQTRSGYQAAPQASQSLPQHRLPPSTAPVHPKQQPSTTDINRTQMSSTAPAATVAVSQPPAKPDVRQTKRYSSQRQRNIADTENPTPPPPPPPPPSGLTMVPTVTQKAGMSAAAGKPTQQVGVLPGGQIVPLAASVGGKPDGPRVVSPPGVGATTSSPVRARVSPQYFIQQQQQQPQSPPQQAVFRQPPPVYRSVPTPQVTSPQSPPLSGAQQAQFQQHLLQQQAIAMQVPTTQIQAGRIYATSQPVARPAAGAITMATAAPAAQQVMTQRTQFIPAAAAAAPLVNLTATRPPGHFPLTGQVPVQFPVPPPQRAEVPRTTANVASVVQGQIVTLPPVPRGQLPATGVALPTGQHPPVAQSQVPGQVVGPPGPGQPPAIHVRGGTTYFDPQIQLIPDGRSPVRRQKEPIPIVKPQLVAGSVEGGETGQFYETSEGLLYHPQQYALAYVEAQMYGLHEQQPAINQQDQQQQQSDEVRTSSSFENLLKQSGSLDNIKEFHPQSVNESLGTTTDVVVSASETDLIGTETDAIGNNSVAEGDGELIGGNRSDGDSEIAKGLGQDLEELHITGSSEEHELSAELDYHHIQLHGNQSYSSEGNQSYSSVVGEDTDESPVKGRDIGDENSEHTVEGREVRHLVDYTLDGSEEHRYITTEESDSEQFYEAENDIESEELTKESETENTGVVGPSEYEMAGVGKILDNRNITEFRELEGMEDESSEMVGENRETAPGDLSGGSDEYTPAGEIAEKGSSTEYLEDNTALVNESESIGQKVESESVGQTVGVASETTEDQQTQFVVKRNVDVKASEESKQMEGEQSESISGEFDVS